MLTKFKFLVPRITETTVKCVTETKLHTLPNFTKNSYDVQRGRYNNMEEHHMHFFRNLLGENGLIMDLCDLEKYNVDFFKHLRGSSSIVLRPTTTEQVSEIVSYCNKNLLAVCTQGGNTGVCGGATPVFDEIIISTEFMNKILHVDEISGVLTCQAGCVLQNLDNFLVDKNLMIPLDLGGRGSCHIGGNVATNAGGKRLYRYGNLHGNVLGLEVVKADGEVLDCLNTLKKDNTGFHLKNLFIGSEGSLGIITKVSIQCTPKPKSIHLAFLGVQNIHKALKAFKRAKQDLGEVLSAVEVMDHESMKLMEEHANMSSPIGPYPVYLFIEIEGIDEKHDQEKLHKYLETCMEKHYILNGLTESSPLKREKLWAIRERIGAEMYKDGYVFMYDISLPFQCFHEFMDDMKKHMGDKSQRVFGFGHLGDDNLHLQITMKTFSMEYKNYIERYVYRRIKELNGSISAEHGIGFLKKEYLPVVKTKSNFELMKTIKKMLDPNGILNPYKVI